MENIWGYKRIWRGNHEKDYNFNTFPIRIFQWNLCNFGNRRVINQRGNESGIKKIAKEYLIKKAKDHKDLAERYKSLSNLSKGGKALSSIEEHKKYKKLAEHCEKEASIYEREANNL
ncbi:hypothetical protein LEP1GSC188_0332 [Leptospira weilii serovar Topaz str. LT2116]|uniref:Uncharacterized protein n=1 Tax=Leptospira weilii serovar Topaz str. LT2116 TaxID=1088540 RepID=M3H0J4_9LEPT|nr:hypothetical protein LEP1GSC188_0332 [Leptospira weilii serovar Topaz str. LT2116]